MRQTVAVGVIKEVTRKDPTKKGEEKKAGGAAGAAPAAKAKPAGKKA